MAALTSLREACLYMIRVGRCLVILRMAGDACGIGQLVISVDVTQGALQRGVRSG